MTGCTTFQNLVIEDTYSAFYRELTVPDGAGWRIFRHRDRIRLVVV